MRNIGAFAYGIGAYSNDVGLATPIESILGEEPEPPSGAKQAKALIKNARPLSMPLSGGLSPGLAKAVTRAVYVPGALFSPLQPARLAPLRHRHYNPDLLLLLATPTATSTLGRSGQFLIQMATKSGRSAIRSIKLVVVLCCFKMLMCSM